MNHNILGSIPQIPLLLEYQFSHTVARDTRAESTATDCKIAQLMAQRKRLRESAKKMKQCTRIQIEKLGLTEQKIQTKQKTERRKNRGRGLT